MDIAAVEKRTEENIKRILEQKAIEAEERTPREVPTSDEACVDHSVCARAARYEAEGNTAMAEHTRRMYHLSPKVAAAPLDSSRT
jgi:hypothetical protein